MTVFRVGALFLVGATWPVAFVGPVAADDARPGHADLARQLAEEVAVEVLADPASDPFDDWSKAVSKPAAEAAGVPPVRPARPATAEVLLFTSLAVPAASWRGSAWDAARIGAPLVLRGVVESLPDTARRIASRLGNAKAGVAIDPRLFRLFGITRVPAIVVVPGGVPPCRSRGCADDVPPLFDQVTGNLSMAAALEAVAAEGEVGRGVARQHLAILRGTKR